MSSKYLGIYTEVSAVIHNELRDLYLFGNPAKMALTIERKLMARGLLSRAAVVKRRRADATFSELKRTRQLDLAYAKQKVSSQYGQRQR